MDETLKEFGKGLFNFANLGMVLIYFQHISENVNNIMDGMLFGLSIYSLGLLLIFFGRELELIKEEK